MGLSTKQTKILEFPFTDYDALICDGAIRSGKSSLMSIAFVIWMMANFKNQNFAFCGRSVGAVERNVIRPLLSVKYIKDNFLIKYSRTPQPQITVKRGARENIIYVFGGKDANSYMTIQGVTLAGVLLDEVALMPRSFVEQALGRCSVDNSKYWFNCNPESPRHWFRLEWILQTQKRNALHLHFMLDDNPGLSEAKKEQYKKQFSGVFHERYILGRWVIAEGLIYDMFDQTENTYKEEEKPIDLQWSYRKVIACDYGTTNPTVFLEIRDNGENVLVDNEYRFDSRKMGFQKTDNEYVDDLIEFMGDENCVVIVDPSAASFIEALRRKNVFVTPANNEVLAGIRKLGAFFKQRTVKINERCAGLIDELGTYRWDEKSSLRGEDKPIKESDHAPDALRYYVNSLDSWRFDWEV